MYPSCISIGDFESKQKFKDILSTATEFTGDFSEFTCASEVCAEAAANFQDTKMSITIGSSGVDYSTPSAPVFKGAVGFGGIRESTLNDMASDPVSENAYLGSDMQAVMEHLP